MFRRNEKGFTMIEMMVVLIIIAVLIGFGIKFYTGYISKSKVTKAKGDITTIQGALDSYYAEHNAYPDEDKLSSAGVSTDVVGPSTSSTHTYLYKKSTDNEYSVYTRVTYDGTHYVIGTGKDGRSNPPDDQATSTP